MNEPRLFTRIVGSPPVFACLMLIVAIMAIGWLQDMDSTSGWVPIIALFIGSSTSTAFQQMRRYKKWKRNWDAMAGIQPFELHPNAKIFFLLVADVAVGYWLTLNITEPLRNDIALGIVAFGAANLFLFMKFVRSIGGRNRGASKRRREHIVNGCLPIPRTSARVVQLAAKLPRYCQYLLSRR